MRILATDDDPIILELVSQFLITVGQHDVVTAKSASEALDLLSKNDPAYIECFLNDIQMPQMDGIELARQIRKLPNHATSPIIMLTAMSEKRYIDDAFAAGASDYITKPFDMIEFKTRISMAEQLVLSRKTVTAKLFAPSALKIAVGKDDAVDLHAPVELNDIDNVIACSAMENYVAQLSRSSLFGSTVFAFTLRKPETYCEALSPAEFKFLLEDVAECISDCLADHQFLMTYAGNGTYLCITESGWRPEMSKLMAAVNLHLNQMKIVSNTSAELYPRVSAGNAIRLVWKSNDQVLSALGKAQTSAEHAAAEFERLKSDFFHTGRLA
ncbi:response regulator [uncultured Sulfitobacter sp.]|uniref:response regulator n=1 Tax=uncultured Sulfitobacter sp. TaxID=191468 RepID=UPI002626ABFD|nr:response regulator [uncultured Sulfitobacter sp.]